MTKSYVCNKCKKSFIKKSHLNSHQNKKISCTKLFNIIEDTKIFCNKQMSDNDFQSSLNDYKCPYCKKGFSKRGNVLYHLDHSCKIVREANEKKNELENLKEEVKLLKEIKLLKEEKINLSKQERKLESPNKNQSTIQSINQSDSKETQQEEPVDINKKQPKNRIPTAIRNCVWNMYMGIEKKQGLCFCCNSEPITSANFHCGHVVASSKGGTNKVQNLRPVCGLCNSSMGSTNMEEFKETYGLEKCENWDGIKA
jgi:hypothetical protein